MNEILLGLGGGIYEDGTDIIFAEAGNYTWAVPEGINNICVLAMAAGEAARKTATGSAKGGAGADVAWVNDVPVTPGQTLTITVGKGELYATIDGRGSSPVQSGTINRTIIAGILTANINSATGIEGFTRQRGEKPTSRTTAQWIAARNNIEGGMNGLQFMGHPGYPGVSRSNGSGGSGRIQSYISSTGAIARFIKNATSDGLVIIRFDTNRPFPM